MKMKNILIELEEQNSGLFPKSDAEMQRLSWHVENLNIVRIGSFLKNLDEVAQAGSHI